MHLNGGETFAQLLSQSLTNIWNC